jgi:predicted AAA+ superfamily ATPase
MVEEIIKSFLDWNPWIDSNFPEQLLGFEREIDILKYLDFKEIKILEGSRRSGKSTLMYQTINKILKTNKNIAYINFDDEILAKYSLEEVYESLLEKINIDYLFVDEIQNCKNWVAFIRKMYDTQSLKQIWITGSNSSLIKKDYSKLLTGRNITLNINTLNFREFLKFNKIDFNLQLMNIKKKILLIKSFQKYAQFGGFPEVVLREVNHKELLINYYEDFLYKDIVARYNINSQKLKKLGLYLESNCGKLVSYRNLAKTLELNYNSVVDYINYYLEVYLFSFLYKFDYSIKKQISSERKIYSMDTGISNALSFKFSEDKGRLFENIVFLELKRQNKEIYYHKEKKECDFVIKEGLEIVSAIQVTTSLSDLDTKEREIKGLLEALKTYNLKEGLILTQDEEGEEVIDNKKIIIKPIWRWLLNEID